MSQVLSVAKELVRLSIAGDEKDPLTNFRLQKLLYYAQAWSLVIRDSQLYEEEIEAWRHGPVVPKVHRGLPEGQGANQLDLVLFDDQPDLDPDDTEFVHKVWESYNQYSALQLSKMTHGETPWQKAWGNRPADGNGNDTISVDDMEAYFAVQAVPAPLAAYSHELRRREDEAVKKLVEMPPLDPGRLIAASQCFTPAAKHVLTGEFCAFSVPVRTAPN